MIFNNYNLAQKPKGKSYDFYVYMHMRIIVLLHRSKLNIWDKTKRENDYAEDRLKKIKRLHYQVESHIETKIVYKMIEGVTLGR